MVIRQPLGKRSAPRREQVVAKPAHRLVEGRLLVAGDHDELDLSEGGQRRHATILAAGCENHVRRV